MTAPRRRPSTLAKRPMPTASAGASRSSAPAERRQTDQPEPDGADSKLEHWLKLVSTVVAPTTVLTALLFYFGYVATTAEFLYFGVTLGSLGLSTQDFLLRSVAVLYVPLGLVLVVTLGLLWLHSTVVQRLEADTTRTGWHVVAAVLLVAGGGLFIRGVVGVAVPNVARTEPIAMTPLCLGFGTAAVAYGRFLLRYDRPQPVDWSRRWPEVASVAVVVGLLLVSLFWAANSFAAAYGRGRAQALAERLNTRPAVVLDTRERLYLAYEGVDETPLPVAADQDFRYRYRGLRVLAESNGRIFLLPEQWTPETGAVVVVPANGDVRLQFYRTPS
jgi:hypothetical protein